MGTLSNDIRSRARLKIWKNFTNLIPPVISCILLTLSTSVCYAHIWHLGLFAKPIKLTLGHLFDKPIKLILRHLFTKPIKVTLGHLFAKLIKLTLGHLFAKPIPFLTLVCNSQLYHLFTALPDSSFLSSDETKPNFSSGFLSHCLMQQTH